MAEPETYTMENAPGYQLMLTSRVYEARIEKALESQGITRAEFAVLYAIGRGRRAPADIVGFFDLQEGTTATTVEQLTSRGLVEAGEPGGKAHLTSRGTAVLKTGIAAAAEENARIRSALSPAEQKTFVDMMERIRSGEKVRRTSI